MTDPISDMLIRIKNAQHIRAERVLVPASKLRFSIATLLKDAGYLSDVSKKKRKAKRVEHDWLDLGLRYDRVDGSGAISGVKLISKPSRHIYIKAEDIRTVHSGHGIAVISTSKGILTSQAAKKEGVGGEVLFEIW